MNRWSLIIISCLSMFSCSYADKEEKLVYATLKRASAQIEKRFRVECIGHRLSAPKKIKMMGLIFEIREPLTVEKGRELVVAFTQILLENINNDKRLRPYLLQFPFTERNINIDIFSRMDDGSSVYEPYIVVAGLCRGRLSYCAKSPEKEYGYSWRLEETYQEAINKLDSE